ncbi:unnamed protein product [Rotaria magnacalcarata]|uniref:Uncharacterized protein n=9 Tax=Rotaria magnacalcarata TaxID=392030 RepID=A0A816TES8_9BILA|nr:unnamed protein product [Rotaria magnacalcarata]CAF3738652.1 unnamed protein product [Rotaria magnacalcarata]
MAKVVSIAAIDQKMVEMRIKNLELLKRHQEIEEDRQLAVRLDASTTATNIETIKDTITMKGATKNRTRIPMNQQNSQENPYERKHRPPVRRKFEVDRCDIQPQRAQRVDYNRLKHERTQEINNQKQYNNNTNNVELHKYVHPFHYQSENNNDLDEPTHAKKLVIVNNKADRIGSGRFSQQQRVQEREQQKREERMRRCILQNNGHAAGGNEFHLDVPPMPFWQNAQIPVQLLPTNINGHHAGADHLVNTGGDQMDQSAYIHNYVYPPSTKTSTFNGNASIYFAHPTPSMTNGSNSSQTSARFHQYHSTRSFENSNQQQQQQQQQIHLPSFQSSSIFQSSPLRPQLSISSTSNNHQEQESLSTDFSSNYRRLKPHDQETKLSQQRPMSSDLERLQNAHSSSTSRFNNNHRFQSRPQSFYDFSSNQQINNNNNVFRSSNNSRYQRNNTAATINNNNNNNNTSLPLSAYMTTDELLDQNDNKKHNNNNHWGATNPRRRPTQQRTYQQDKHQFPLSSYDPRQYGFNNNSQQRNDFHNRSNTNRCNVNNNRNNNNIELNSSNDIDLIDEWWKDNNSELIGTEKPVLDTNSKAKTVDDSGNSSLSTSMNLKESTLDDMLTNDFVNPPSNVSTTDSNIIESLDKLQQQLILEEAVDERLESTNNNSFIESIENRPNKTTTYDTAHFMQWARDKFREELAGRLTAQEIQQHDAATTDDDDADDDADHPLTTNNEEKINTLEDDLNEKLTINENITTANPTFVAE